MILIQFSFRVTIHLLVSIENIFLSRYFDSLHTIYDKVKTKSHKNPRLHLRKKSICPLLYTNEYECTTRVKVFYKQVINHLFIELHYNHAILKSNTHLEISRSSRIECNQPKRHLYTYS